MERDWSRKVVVARVGRPRRAVAMSVLFCRFLVEKVSLYALIIYKISTSCELKSPQFLTRQKCSGSKSTRSRPFSPEIYPKLLQNYTISPFRAKMRPWPLALCIKITALFFKESDPISPLFAQTLQNHARGHCRVSAASTFSPATAPPFLHYTCSVTVTCDNMCSGVWIRAKILERSFL